MCLGVLVTWYDDIMEIFTVLGVGNKVFIRLAWLGWAMDIQHYN